MRYTKEELFESLPIPRAVAALSVPTVLSSLVMVLYNTADTYFVGLLNDPVQTAAVTLAAPVLLAFNAVNNLFGIGSSSMLSRALGSKDSETVRRSSAFGFYGSFFAGILFSVLCVIFQPQLLRLIGTDSTTADATQSYLLWTVSFGAAPSILNVVMAYLIRAEGAAVHASIGTMSGCILNIVLDPIFIMPWGLNMGAAGAGLATFLSNCFAVLYFLIYLFAKRGKTVVCISPKAFGFRKNIVKGVMGVGVPASIQNLLNVTGSMILNNLAAPFGAAALAAMGICTKINTIPMYIAQGISQGVMPLISYTYASGDHTRMKKTLRFSAIISESILILSTLVMFFASEPLNRVFIDDPETIAYGARMLKGFCLAQPFLAFDFLVVALFQATGFGRESLVFAILRKVVFEIPFIFLFNYLWPLYGLPYAQAAAEVLMTIIAAVTLRQFFKNLKQNAPPPVTYKKNGTA